MRNSHGVLLMSRLPFLSGFFAGVFLVAALVTTLFPPTQGDPTTQPATVEMTPSVDHSVELADTRLSIRALRNKVTNLTQTENSDTHISSLLVSRGGRGQATRDLSTSSSEPPTEQSNLDEPGNSLPLPLLEMDPVHWPTDKASITVTGMDYSAPRQLVLWRKQGGDVARLALGQSNAMGEFEFAQVIVPLKGFELFVTGTSTTDPLMDPDAVGIVLRPPLPPPSVTSREDSENGIHFQLHPALDEGNLLIVSQADGLIDQIPIKAQAAGLAAGIELPEATSAFMDQDFDCVGYQVAQELEDGRVSDWAILPCAQLNL